MMEYNTASTLKHARQALRMTQDAFGEALGVHWTTISRYERGAPIPRVVALAVECLLRRSKE
jgi:DNA-binding XRE family transcriptional regulator